MKYSCWQFDIICIIPFILNWPYNIYSIRIYVLSTFGMVNGLSISFLNLKISFFVVLFYFFSFLRFPLFSRWLFDCLYLKPFQWVHVKVLAELEILDLMRYVTMLLWILILLFHLHLWVYFVLQSICYYVLSSG